MNPNLNNNFYFLAHIVAVNCQSMFLAKISAVSNHHANHLLIEIQYGIRQCAKINTMQSFLKNNLQKSHVQHYYMKLSFAHLFDCNIHA